ncbi:single-strand binding protein [Ammonifex degensii KC4]|uniref:Single-stranded DNA-binding protein n=1 Tax=Ammonifex degensii (strain DSM 10501 / KC4) TaxID=429009 RepID=C9RC58_AMMDK|nr:single-stranded DNA-binding protein [Ammonifex degensii]ACX51835.1 single-strand binding protein [Ammonifex degensii KC4]
MLNRVILIGRLVRDPELRHTPQGTSVGGFTVAVDRPAAQEGERKADFIDVVVWSGLAEVCCRNLTKGRLVAVEGRLQTRSYEDSRGIRRRVAEVVAENVRFLDRPKDAGAGKEEKPVSVNDEGVAMDEDVVMAVDDDIPF